MSGQQIKQIILSKGIKQTFVANKIGVHPVTLNRFLNGNARLDDTKKVRLFNFLDIEP